MINNRLAVVVLNWNCADDAVKCMESLLAQKLSTDILLIDNASRPESIKELESYVTKKRDSRITLLKNTVNSGYAGGNNFGFQYALEKGYAYIGTLNPDAIADRNWTQSLADELGSNTDTGIATGILARSDKKHIDTTGEQYTTWGLPGPRGRGALLSTAPTEPEYVFGSTGGGFIARADMLHKVGLFDERFFMYYEDVDLCFRAQLLGYRVRYTPKAVAYHKIGASTNKVPGLAVKQTFKNLPMLFVKDVPLSLWMAILPRFTLTYLLILGNAIAHGNGLPALVGWWKSLGLIPHMWRERRRIQSSRKVSDKYIDSIILHDIPPGQTGMRKFRAFFTGKQ